ncbi:phage upper tail fiber protein [Nocardia acidivorans]|uniref:phage upper tail fiber protein n=1 Tax=Nocardia acidivorans TaxID=404580 RepID=UPI00082A8F9E|nr:hypothetical protein [Nocardia acidivorans]
MTVLFDHFNDLEDVPVNGVCEIWRPTLSPDVDGEGVTTPNRVVVPIIAGELRTPDLDPGPAKVMLRLGEWSAPRNCVIPASATPVRLTPLFGQYEPQPPAVVSEAWLAANQARAARDEAVLAADGVRDISKDAAQVAADKATTIAARDVAVTARGEAVAARVAADASRDTASQKAGAAATNAAGAAADRAAAETAKNDAVAARDVSVAARDTATAKATDATKSAADAAKSAQDAANAGGVPTTRTVATGGGLTGGGDLSADRALSLAANGVTNSHIADGALSQAKLAASGIITDALNARELISRRGAANGYAALDASGKVPATQLPSYVDDVIESASTAAFPTTGEVGKIYIAVDSNKVYRWGGSSYTEISPSPGSTDAVPEGTTNRYFTDARAQAANTAALATKAADSTVVHLAGAETISGAKTFSAAVVVPAPTAAGHAARKQDVDAKVGSDGSVLTVLKMTQAAFDALGTGRPSSTIYVIVG